MAGLALVSWVVALVGDLTASLIFDSRPGLLLAMNPRLRYLVNGANELSPAVYFAVGFARLVASDPLYYLLGYWFGDRVLPWVARRSRTYGHMVEDGARMFRKAAYPIIFLSPSSPICAMAGATGVGPVTFFVVNITGTIVRLGLVWFVGDLIGPQVDAVQGWIAGNRIWFFLLSIAALAWTLFGEFRGNNGEVAGLRALTDDDAGDESGDQPAGDGATGTGPAGGGDPAPDRVE